MKKYTITIFTENIVGLLLRITAVFTRRHINIDSLTVSETERKGISRFTIVITEPEEMVIKVTKQINRIIEVIYAQYHSDEDLIFSQLAMYKISVKQPSYIPILEATATQNGARVLVKTDTLVVLEKTGSRKALETFFEELQKFGEVEFVRSGRIALTVEGLQLKDIIPQLADLNHYPNYSMKHHEEN